MSKLAGKVAVVTGASKGIGAAIAKAFAAEGAAVVVNYASSREGAEAVVASIQDKGGKALAVQGDVARAADVKRLFAETKTAFGRVDILVNNAGIYEFAPIDAINEEHFHKQFNINVLGLLLATQEAVAHIGPEGGSVINVSSLVSRAAFPGTAVYSATKGAVDAVTRVLAKELGPRQIRVNAVNPGVVETEGSHSAGVMDGDFAAQAIAQTPLGRVGQPDDIASVAVFLATSDSGWISGETILVTGGMR